MPAFGMLSCKMRLSPAHTGHKRSSAIHPSIYPSMDPQRLRCWYPEGGPGGRGLPSSHGIGILRPITTIIWEQGGKPKKNVHPSFSHPTIESYEAADFSRLAGLAHSPH